MRILLCSNFYYRRGGDCTYLFALQKLLEENSHETAIFSMRHPQNLPCPQENCFIDFLDYSELNKSKSPANAVKVLQRSIWSRQAQKNLARLVADWRPDVAHLQNIHAYLTPAIVETLAHANIPVVWSLHDFKLLCPESHFLSHGRICEACRGGHFGNCAKKRCLKGSLAASWVAMLEAYVHRWKRVTQHIGRFIVPSHFVKQKFVEFGFMPERVMVLPHFLPSIPPLASNANYGLYAGTLLPFKGVETLLRALAKAPPHPFHILGDGPLRADYERQARELGLSQVMFRGFLADAELEAAYAEAAYAVVPSECYETFSYAAQEPQARGIPVIAAQLGALPERVIHGETGLLFPPGDFEALAARMGQLWNDADLRRQLGTNARRHAIKTGDANPYARDLRDLYAKVISSSSRGGV